jgi:tetratricopeptide (TPR) repeat protein
MAPRLEQLARKFQLLGLDAEALVLHERALEMLLLMCRANATARKWGREYEVEQKWHRWQQSRGKTTQQEEQQKAAQLQYGVLLKKREQSVQQNLGRVLAEHAIAHQSIAASAEIHGGSSLQRQAVSTAHQKALALSRQAMAALKGSKGTRDGKDDCNRNRLPITQLLQLQGWSLACLARLDYAGATSAVGLGGEGDEGGSAQRQPQYHSLHHEAIRCFNQVLARLQQEHIGGSNGDGSDTIGTSSDWPSSPQVASTLFEIGSSMQQLGLLEEASAKFEKCASVCRIVFGDHTIQLQCARSKQQACAQQMEQLGVHG